MAAVSRAESMSRSTSSTFAPSLANTIAAARPVPTVSPGDCPAPTTIPALPASRTVRAYSPPRPADAIVSSERAERHSDDVETARQPFEGELADRLGARADRGEVAFRPRHWWRER